MAQSDHADINPATFGSSTVGGYGLVNLAAGYQLSEDFELRLRIGNLLDKEYQIVDGFNTQDRNAQLTLNYSF